MYAHIVPCACDGPASDNVKLPARQRALGPHTWKATIFDKGLEALAKRTAFDNFCIHPHTYI